ncbi:hypothetical protein CLF_107813 [Clonorchis sinensis]|uniref:Uncharacterized protein n=1 Tax=Clonorchis sinensis TaxID=79923 RepID=G7YH76_CLOSI|nr:hypothetical protein CLF_107813 [Clonorchis sinensis]
MPPLPQVNLRWNSGSNEPELQSRARKGMMVRRKLWCRSVLSVCLHTSAYEKAKLGFYTAFHEKEPLVSEYESIRMRAQNNGHVDPVWFSSANAPNGIVEVFKANTISDSMLSHKLGHRTAPKRIGIRLESFTRRCLSGELQFERPVSFPKLSKVRETIGKFRSSWMQFEHGGGPSTVSSFPDVVIIIIDSMTSVFTTDVSLPYKHDCEEKNKSGRGRDVVLAYYNHSKYPSPGATMTLTIDRGKRIFEDENDVRFTERVLSRSDRIVLCWYFALNYANQPVKCTPSSCVPALR